MPIPQAATVPAALIVAGIVVVGLAAPAAGHEASHLIKGSSIAKHSIPGNRLENNAVTGAQIKESTLGTVPKATRATKLPALVWHVAALKNGWQTTNTSTNRDGPASYALDAQGVVHLKGGVGLSPAPIGGTPNTIVFTLPVGMRPEHFMTISVPQVSDTTGELIIAPTGIVTVEDDEQMQSSGAQYTSLDGVTFPTN
jgi:hypothetical protein